MHCLSAPTCLDKQRILYVSFVDDDTTKISISALVVILSARRNVRGCVFFERREKNALSENSALLNHYRHHNNGASINS